MKEFLKSLVYENGVPSRTGLIMLLIGVVPLAVWAFVTIYLAITGKPCPFYTDMTAGSVGSGAVGGAGMLGNKAINSFLNSARELFPDKGGQQNGTTNEPGRNQVGG